MKRLFLKSLFAALAVVMSGLLTGCNPEEKVKQFSVAFKEAGPGHVTLTATVPGVTKCAYLITENEPAAMMNPTILNMAGKSLYIYSDGDVQLLDFEIKENTKYYVYFVAILSDSSFSQLYEWEFETGEFTFNQLATTVAVAPDGYKMRITVPESVKNSVHGQPGSRAIRYSQSDLMLYNFYRSTDTDYSHLLYNAGKYLTEDTTLSYSDAENWGTTGADTNLDGVVDDNGTGLLWNPIAPGEPVVFLAGEFEWMAEPEDLHADSNYVVNGFYYPAGWEPGYYLPCIDSAKYWGNIFASKAMTKGLNNITNIDLSTPFDNAWTGAFQRKLFRTRVPDVLNAKIDVKVEDLRSVNATIVITPDEQVYRYLFTILDTGMYEEMLRLLDGNAEYLQWAVTSYFSMYNFGAIEVKAGAGSSTAPIAEVVLEDLLYVQDDSKYHVLVTGMSGEIGSPQCFTHFEFSTPKKTKTTGPTIVVEALEEEYEDDPFGAHFNIKCTSVADNPAVKCFYGANYYKDWILSKNSGNTYESLGQSAAFTPDEVEQINSEKGLTIRIPSIDGEKTRLVVVAFNDENISNGVDEYRNIEMCPAVADYTTPFFEAETLTNSDLFNDGVITGDWTMTAVDVNGNTLKSKVAIKNRLVEGVDYPSELPAEVLEVYKKTTKWSDEEIYGYFNRFKELAEQYNEKRLSGQNKLLLEGWLGNDSQGRFDLMTPWDMFIDEQVVTVDVESLFSEFGPKLYIEVNKDMHGKDSLSITSDRMYASPALNWSMSLPVYLAGRANQEVNNTIFYYGTDGYYTAPLVFPVEMSEDRNVIKIKPIHSNGLDWYPTLIGVEATGGYVAENPTVSEIVLTKGWTEEQEPAAPAPAAVRTRSLKGSAPVAPVNKIPSVVCKPKTHFAEPAETIKIKGEVMTAEKVHANIEKFVSNQLKGIR